MPLKANPSLAWATTSKQGEAQLSKSCAKLARGMHGSIAIYNEALLIGGFVTVDLKQLVNASSLPAMTDSWDVHNGPSRPVAADLLGRRCYASP